MSEADAQGYFEYLALLYKRFRIAKDNFLQRPFRKPTDFYNPKSLIAGFRLHTLGDAYSSVSRYVSDDRLRKALAFQTLYIGISPYEGPSLYMIIPVSYTHLDVYKRQSILHASCAQSSDGVGSASVYQAAEMLR